MPRDSRLELVDGRFGADPVGTLQVLVLDEIEPDRRRVQLRERAAVLLATDREHVVTGREPRDRVPVRHRVGVLKRRAGVHRDDGRVRVGGEQPPAPEHRVVEVWRHHDDSLELARRDEPPIAHLVHGVSPELGHAGQTVTSHGIWVFVSRTAGPSPTCGA